MPRTQLVILDSTYRYSGTNNNPRYNLPDVGVKGRRVYVNTVGLPHSFYNITSNNNNLYWIDSLTASLTSTIPVGNYSISELLTELGTQMTADATDGLTYSASRDTKTNKVTITNSGPTNFALNTNSSTLNGIRTMLGFYANGESNQDTYGDYARLYIGGNLSGASSYTAVDSYYIAQRSVFIRSNLTRKAQNYESTTLTYNNIKNSVETGRKDYLIYLPVTTDFGDMMEWKVGNDPVKLDLNSNVTELTFELVDEDNNQIDLNGRSWTIEIVFEC